MDLDATLHRVRTRHKTGERVLAPSLRRGTFDSHAVDCPFPFRHEGRFWMTFIGWDGAGYQTGLAVSDDLFTWHKQGLLLGRGARGSVTEFNVAMTCIVRDNGLHGPGMLRQVGGRYIGAYRAYPRPGYEAGPAVIGLCTSTDLRHWDVGEPILRPHPACSWESGGLDKAWLLESGGTYYLFYNAKNHPEWPWIEQTGVALSRDLVRWERHPANPVLKVGASGSSDDLFTSDPCVLRGASARQTASSTSEVRRWRV